MMQLEEIEWSRFISLLIAAVVLHLARSLLHSLIGFLRVKRKFIAAASFCILSSIVRLRKLQFELVVTEYSKDGRSSTKRVRGGYGAKILAITHTKTHMHARAHTHRNPVFLSDAHRWSLVVLPLKIMLSVANTVICFIALFLLCSIAAVDYQPGSLLVVNGNVK